MGLQGTWVPPRRRQGGRPGALEERRQQGLGDEADGAGAAGLLRHVKEVISRFGSPGLEGEFLAVEFGAVDLGPGDPGQGLDRGEVLGPQPGLGAPGPDPLDPDRRPQQG